MSHQERLDKLKDLQAIEDNYKSYIIEQHGLRRTDPVTYGLILQDYYTVQDNIFRIECELRCGL